MQRNAGGVEDLPQAGTVFGPHQDGPAEVRLRGDSPQLTREKTLAHLLRRLAGKVHSHDRREGRQFWTAQ